MVFTTLAGLGIIIFNLFIYEERSRLRQERIERRCDEVLAQLKLLKTTEVRIEKL
jgi:hypothetical protein